MPSDINYADRLYGNEFLTDSVLPSGLVWQLAMCQVWFVTELKEQQYKAQTCTHNSVVESM